MVIAGPIVSSIKGRITRPTPHFVHVLFCKYVMGKKNAGRPGYAPFPSGLSAAADFRNICTFLREAETDPAPTFGRDTDAVLGEEGVEDAEIRVLREDGVVGLKSLGCRKKKIKHKRCETVVLDPQIFYRWHG